VHSRYERTLADAAIAARPAVVRLTVRRFFCSDDSCPVGTFAERVPGLTSRYARRTPSLTAQLTQIGLALAGRGPSGWRTGDVDVPQYLAAPAPGVAGDGSPDGAGALG
jgi:hypothetical protein